MISLLRIIRIFSALFTLSLLSSIDRNDGALVERLSFQTPFEKISAQGVRQVNDKWKIGGTTVVNKHFARLTPDRQAKRGNLWNNQQIRLNDFSLIFTFRISGQGSRWFGDGLALWITNRPEYVEGDFHGFTHQYTGIGIIFDTFVNAEHANNHKDIFVAVNDGKKSLDSLNYEEKIGCDMDGMRYHEKNAAFSASVNATRVKIQLKGQKLTIEVDAKNAGEWTRCYEGDIKLQTGWAWQSNLGITATTGALADNHDVIGLSIYDTIDQEEYKKMDEMVKNRTSKSVDVHQIDGSAEDRILELKKQFEKLQVDFEHQVTALKEETENTIEKLRKQEVEDEKRIEQLEEAIKTRVETKISKVMNKMEVGLESELAEKVTEIVKHSSGWKLPFFLLVIAIAVTAIFGYRKYQDLRKSHLL